MLQVADATARTAAGAAGRPRAPGATTRLNPDNSDDDEDAPKTRPCSWEHMSYERAQVGAAWPTPASESVSSALSRTSLADQPR